MIQRILSRFRSDERGAVLVIVALGAVVMVGISALAIDLGMLYTARSEAQRAADAAALAGASAFQDGDPTQEPELIELAKARAYETAGHNSIRNVAIDPTPEVEVIVEPIAAESKVRVTIRRQNIGLWFAQILGIRHATVSAKAAAEAAPATAAAPSQCIKPFAIPDMWEKGATSPQDGNNNRIWDFGPKPGCKQNNCDELREQWSWQPGDEYRGASTTDPKGPTGYGTGFRNGQRDYNGGPNDDPANKREYHNDDGRRVPIKIMDVPSYWQLWAYDKSGGANAIKEAIRTCVDSVLDIGMTVEANKDTTITTGQGNKVMKVYEGITELIDDGEKDRVVNGETIPGRPGDPHAYWDERTGTVQGSDPKIGGWQNSARVITVALFDPSDMGSGKHQITFKDFALLFLEDPRAGDNPFAEPYQKQAFKRPITGRLLKYTPGAIGGGTEVGNLPKVLRLVE